MFTGSTRTGKKVAEAAASADPGVARARRQGPDDRARRRRPRARGQRRHLLLDAERRPDLHLDRARLRRGAGLRRVRRQGHREGARAAPGRAATGPARSRSARSPSRRSSRRFEDHVTDAVDKGARVLAGGQPPRRARGRFYEPTVLVDVDHSMKCMTEETFGPTLPIMKVADADEAVRLANDSPYGLGASVFTQGRRARRADRAAHRGRRRVRQRRDDQLHRARAADGRREGTRASARATAPAGSASTASQQTILVTPARAQARTAHVSRTRRATRKLLAGVFKLLYGRGKRD